MKHRAFVAFSGGGAKGIVHVAALKSLEQREVQFVGLSGTSAGSLVATLAAAGFTADDLINPVTGSTILNRLTAIDSSIKRVIDLFGTGGWTKIRMFRWLMRHRRIAIGILVFAWISPSLLIWAATQPGSDYSFYAAIFSYVVIGIAFGLTYRQVMSGLADLTKLRSTLARLLQEKMFPEDPERVVRMSDFGRNGRPPLKIVSANLNLRRLHLFSAERTPLTPVADAVAASLCLPIIFGPWKIDQELHVDGGIVSNLPAWPFDEERELDPEAITIAIEIEAVPDEEIVHSQQWLGAAVRTALFGSGELNVRISGPTERLALPTKLNVLDFDIGNDAAAREVQDVTSAVTVWLDKRLFRLPEIYRNACRVAQSLAEDGLGLKPGGRGGDHRVRVAIGRLDRGYRNSLRFSHCVGFDDDPDESLLIPLEGSVAGAAWSDKSSHLETYPLQPIFDLPGDGNRLRRKIRWPSSTWILCIPILDNITGEPRLLIQLDGNSELKQDVATFTAMETVEDAVKEFFNLVLKELRDLEDSHAH